MVSRSRSPSKASVAHPWHIFFFYRALLNSCLLLFFLLRENFLHQSILFNWSEHEFGSLALHHRLAPVWRSECYASSPNGVNVSPTSSMPGSTVAMATASWKNGKGGGSWRMAC